MRGRRDGYTPDVGGEIGAGDAGARSLWRGELDWTELNCASNGLANERETLAKVNK